MEGAFWVAETDSHLADQEINWLLMKPEGLLVCLQDPITGHYP